MKLDNHGTIIETLYNDKYHCLITTSVQTGRLHEPVTKGNVVKLNTVRTWVDIELDARILGLATTAASATQSSINWT